MLVWHDPEKNDLSHFSGVAAWDGGQRRQGNPVENETSTVLVIAPIGKRWEMQRPSSFESLSQ